MNPQVKGKKIKGNLSNPQVKRFGRWLASSTQVVQQTILQQYDDHDDMVKQKGNMYLLSKLLTSNM